MSCPIRTLSMIWLTQITQETTKIGVQYSVFCFVLSYMTFSWKEQVGIASFMSWNQNTRRSIGLGFISVTCTSHEATTATILIWNSTEPTTPNGRCMQPWTTADHPTHIFYIWNNYYISRAQISRETRNGVMGLGRFVILTYRSS